MTTIYKLLTTFSLCILFQICLSSQHSIDGVNTVCDGDCQTYEVVNGLGGPYFWITSGAITGENNINEVEICWNTIGENEIQLIDFAAPFTSQSSFQKVSVYAYPQPEILFPLYPDCIVRDSLEPGGPNGDDKLAVIGCRTVCSGSTATYTSLIGNGSAVVWEVTGGTIISQTSDEITIEWDVNGSGSIKITETFNGCTASEDYCVEILDPLDVDIIALNGGGSDITICLGQEVYFHGIGSENVTNFEWDFGNNSYSTGSSASAIYDQAGTYPVTLYGSTECGCMAMTNYTVIVESNPGPEIMCTGTVCAGDEQTYFASGTCSSYTWSIGTNGTITDGGGANDDFITINWGTGPVGEIGLSTTGCNTPTCALTTTVQIPIIDSNASIDGPTVVCKNGYSIYSVQYYNGTDYIWNLSGNGSIIDGYGTNEITVRWDDGSNSPDQTTIDVSFDNCHKNCGGQASITVDLLPDFSLDISDLSCDNRTTYINAREGWNSAVVDFIVIDPNGTVLPFPNTSFISETFTIPGEYTITATDSQGLFCNESISKTFVVLNVPDAPISINGPITICKDEFYTYSVNAPNSEYSARWIVNDGTSTFVISGNLINMQWTSNGPYKLTVNFYHNQAPCVTEKLEIDVLPVAGAIISGADVACIDETTSYDSGLPEGNSSSWAITPSDAGSIKLNGDNTIDITWHTAGNHLVSLNYCGASLTQSVTVNPLPNTTVTFPEKICPGEMATINIPASSSTIEIIDESGNFISANNISLVTPGKYKATITTSAGCEEIIPIVIDTFIPPSVRVSSPQENAFCLPHPGILITALNTDDGYTYEWFHEGISLGNTSPQITTTTFGDYHVVVTDQNGCMATSNIHTLYEWCTGDQPPGTCSGGGNAGVLQIGAISLTCNDLEFNLKGSTYNSTSFTWEFGDPDSGINNTATGNNPIHSFSNAGYYYVFLQGNIPGERAVEIFTVPAAPRFDYDVACENSGVQFNNHSTYIPGLPIMQYSWDFGDPGSGTDNTSMDKDPVHVYTSAGTYTATLEITGNDGCTSAFQLQVEVLPGPFGEFVLPQSTCGDEGLLFIAFESDEILSYIWNFDDAASGPANTSTSSSAIHTFSANGAYNVSLTVSDINECTTVITKPINITSSTLSGQIMADQSFPMCFSENVTLTAPSGGIGYLWSNGESAQSITTAQPGIYSVTIADPNGCQYIPDDLNVTVEGVINTRLRAVTYEDDYDYFGTSYFDSISICEGERFNIFAPFISGATYDWSVSSSNSWNISSSEFPQLPAGRHDIQLDVTDPNSGCLVASKPFKVIVNSKPAQITIIAPSSGLCDGESHTLSVDSPDSDLRYYWNTGATGTTINASAAGQYFVIAVNKQGCETQSGSTWISKRPDANRINVGCVTACFPDTICTPFIGSAISYQWLLDGSPVNDVFGNDLIVNQAGDYQLVVANFNGCSDTSGVFTIDAKPSDQTLSGIVFIDTNSNGIWDAGEELLQNVPVNIYNGITIVNTTTTDAAGYYSFDPINTVNPIVRIDTTGLGLKLTGGLFESNADFITCIEDKLQDFPLQKNCTTVEVPEVVMVCSGETITINNIILAEGDVYSFTDQTVAGCDSITNVEVSAFPVADIQLQTQNTCMNTNDGQLEISIMDGSTLQFSIDNTTTFSPDLIYSNLSSGIHTLWLFDAYGCSNSYDFMINEELQPNMASILSNTCDGGNTGSAEITPVTAGNYEYSLDGINFTVSGYFNGLGQGMTTIYAIDNNTGCMHEYPIEIIANPTPEIAITPSNTCSGMTEGSITIAPITSGNYQYSMDGITFTDDLYYGSLASGIYDLYIMEDGNCMQTQSVIITEEPEPLVTFDTEDACIGENNGQIVITPIEPGLEYSLDQINFSSDNLFIDLSAGMYEIFVRGDNNCIHPFDIEVEESPEMEVIFEEPEIDCSVTEVVLAPMVSNEVGSVSFNWNNGSNLESIVASEDGTYDVEISDECSTRSFSYEVDLEEIIEEQPIYFPNIFSPKSNSGNECFKPVLNPETTIISYRMTIFDRWGNKYFQTTDLDECWDGTYHNKDVRAGVFVYLVELEYTYCVNVENIKKYGDVTVLD